MRRRITWIAALALLMTVVLAGCGGKNADSIVKDLDQVVSKMESYQGSGKMTLHTGQQPQTYKVEVWYQKPDYYRISLTNEKRDITQIVLRNSEGVFVLTPQLNKSYRFQSDWPKNQGQVYLYQTLIQSIVMDNSRQFTEDKDNDAYVFDVMAANYQNGSFARQKIWLDQETYKPQRVEVTDTSAHTMVEVTFDKFEFGKKFDSSAFDMKQNMGEKAKPSDSAEQSPSADGSKAPDASNAPDSSKNNPTSGQEDDPTTAAPQESVSIVEPDPEALPVGVQMLEDPSEVQLGDNMGVMLRYTGAYDFTILEMVSRDQAVTLMKGMAVDLGFTMGHLTQGETRTLTWTYNGTEYRLISADLEDADMVKIAQSMEETSGK